MKKLLFLLVVGLILVTGCSIKKTTELSNSEKFAAEYSVSKDNPFVYATIDEVLQILKEGTGIIFFGNSDCEWCVASAEILNEAFNYKNVSKVYYYNPKNIRDNQTKEYKQLIELLGQSLEKDEKEKSYLYLPDIYFVKNGKIIGHNNDAATMDGTVEEALTQENKKELKNKYLELISKYNAGECTNEC